MKQLKIEQLKMHDLSLESPTLPEIDVQPIKTITMDSNPLIKLDSLSEVKFRLI